MEHYSARKNDTLPCATTWTALESGEEGGRGGRDEGIIGK